MWRLLLLLAGSPASADVASHLAGDWGLAHLQDFTCADNPTHITVTGDRLIFTTPHPAPDFNGTPIVTFSGTILTLGATTQTMRRDDETRLDATGAPILWRLHLYPDGFCWERSDQPRPLFAPPNGAAAAAAPAADVSVRRHFSALAPGTARASLGPSAPLP